MNIVQLTPGTGNFHCGLCVRDNALVNALREMGHEVHMVPMYLPMVLDGEETEEDTPILFGGINAYLQLKSSIFRHTPRWIDRIFDSKWLLRWSASKADMTRAKDLGEMTVSTLRGEEGKQAKEVHHLIDWLKQYGQPDLVSISTCLLAGLAPALKKHLGVPVVCTLQGEDGYLDSLPSPYREESWRLLRELSKEIDAYIAVSRYYGSVMRERLGVDDKKLQVVQNGIDLSGFDYEPVHPKKPILGYFARFSYDKAFHVLAEVFILLKKRGKVPGLRLHGGGTATPGDEKYIAQIRKKFDAAGVSADVSIRTNLSREEKIEFFQDLAVFSVPATYGESFGLYVVEALAAGVPVVQPDSGGFPEILEATGGGILTKTGEQEELADAIEALLLDPVRAKALGDQGRKAVFEKFGVERMTREVLAVFEEISGKYVHPK
jgi:glycosyltransferase involved in cell wall biosynthesis